MLEVVRNGGLAIVTCNIGSKNKDDSKHGQTQSRSLLPPASRIEAGKKYAYCTCGLSENQPFCDGKHKGSNFTPMVFEAEVTETAYYCQCKQTGNAPKCDGSHKSVEVDKPEDDSREV